MTQEQNDATLTLGEPAAEGEPETIDSDAVTPGPAGPDEVIHRPLHDWIAANPTRRITVAAASLILIQTLYRGWMCLGGWFVGDDFAFIGHANAMPLWSNQYLLTAYNGHVMPGGFVLVRILNAVWPYNFVPVALVDTGIQLLTAVLFYRLLVALFGHRPAILVPLALYLFTVITLPAFLWWAAALNQLPFQLALVSALLLQLSYLRTGRIWRGLGGVLCIAGGLLFDEKTVLAIPLVFALTALYFTDGPPLRRLGRLLSRHWKVWVAYLVLGSGYGSYYLLEVPSPARGTPGVVNLIETTTTMVGHALLPAVFGGPWSWHVVGANAAIADPPGYAVWLVLILSAAIIAGSIVLHHRAVFGWWLVGGYLVGNILLVAASRALIVGPLIGAEYRYSTDLSLVIALCGALAFLPIRHDLGPTPQRLLRRRSAAEALARVREGEWAELFGPGPRNAGIVIASVVFAFGCVHSGAGYYATWRVNTARPYVQNAIAELGELKAPIALDDSKPPDTAIWWLVYPYDLDSKLFVHVRPQPRYGAPGTVTDALYILDDTGHLRLAAVDGIPNAPGPDGACGWRVQSAPISIPLQHPSFGWTWVMRMGYIASQSGFTTITAGETTATVPIHAGLHVLYVYVTGVVSAIQFSGLTAGALCTDDIQVGSPVPTPGTHP